MTPHSSTTTLQALDALSASPPSSPCAKSASSPSERTPAQSLYLQSLSFDPEAMGTSPSQRTSWGPTDQKPAGRVPASVLLPSEKGSLDAKVLEGEVDQEEKDVYPDGGMEAWIVVAGAFCALLVVFGTISSYGAFVSYYSAHQLASSGQQAIAGIGSVQAASMQIFSILSGPMFDRYGARPVLTTGAVMFVGALIATSFCKELWQFYLCQGLLLGMGASCVFVVPLACVSQYFDRRRGIAVGLCISGPSVGSIITPLMMAQLPSKVGFGWAVRIIALFDAVMLGIAIFTVKTRLPPKKRDRLFNPAAFRQPEYACVALASGFFLFASFFPLYFMQTFTAAKGYKTFAPYSLMLINGCSGVGRISIGFLSDYIGRFNLISLAMGISALMMFIWLAVDSIGGIVAVCILFGTFSGGFASLQVTCIAEICRNPQELGMNIGQIIGFAGLFMIGAPLSGVILGDPGSRLKNFPHAIALNASVLSLCCLFFILARMIVWRRSGRQTWRI